MSSCQLFYEAGLVRSDLGQVTVTQIPPYGVSDMNPFALWFDRVITRVHALPLFSTLKIK